jgi:hypothetical protein
LKDGEDGMGTEERRVARSRSGGPSVRVGAAVLACAAVVFAFEQRSIAAVNGWWVDELFSMWATEPSQTLAQAYRVGISKDPTPPLYYLALYFARASFHLPFERERAVVLGLNLCFVLLMSLVVVWASRRAGLTGLALAGIGAFLVSGPALRSVPDARAYFMAMTIMFAASWLVALVIEDGEPCVPLGCLVVLGALAGLTHLYAALMCCCLGTGLIAVGRWKGRRDLTVSGLGLGLSAAAAYAVWFFFLSEPNVVRAVVWIKYDVTLSTAVREARQLSLGREAAVVACLLAVAGVMHRATRALSVAFCIAFALFVGVPLLVSLRVPVIVGRYWLIGAPAFVVVLVFVARTAIGEAMSRERRTETLRTGPLLLGLTAIGLLVATSVTGYGYARAYTKAKLVWEGAEIVRPLLPRCRAGSIHVYRNVPMYSEISRVAAGYFVDGDLPTTAWLTLADGACPVLGWAEHMEDPAWSRASDAELLRMVKIDAQPGEVEITRHASGFVVLR